MGRGRLTARGGARGRGLGALPRLLRRWAGVDGRDGIGHACLQAFVLPTTDQQLAEPRRDRTARSGGIVKLSPHPHEDELRSTSAHQMLKLHEGEAQ